MTVTIRESDILFTVTAPCLYAELCENGVTK